MRFRLVPTLVVGAIVAAAVFAAMNANPANGFPSRVQPCTNCHPAAPAGTTVSATPSIATPAAGATYTVTISLAGLTSTGDTGYWISDAAGTSIVSGGGAGTSSTSYTQTMTAPLTPGTYSYTVWCERGSTAGGQAKSTAYSITVPAPTAALTSLTPISGQAGATVVINGSNLGTSGVVSFSGTSAVTSAWTANSITCTVPAGLTAGVKNVTVTPGGAAVSNALTFTVTVPAPPPVPAPPSGSDTTAPTTTARFDDGDDEHEDAVTIRLSAIDNSGGVGVATITYSIDGGEPVTVIGSRATLVVDSGDEHHSDDGDHVAGGAHTITYYATDAAGNAEVAHTLTLDDQSSEASTWLHLQHR